MSKKTLTIALIVILVALLFFGLSFFFVSEDDDELSPPADEAPLFPFEGSAESTTAGPEEALPTRSSVSTDAGTLYFLISGEPVAGAGWEMAEEEREVTVTTTVGTTTATTTELVTVEIPYIRFIERATGHIYETRLDTLEETRISNTTIPQIYRAYWGPGARAVAVQTLNPRSFETETTSFVLSRSEEGYAVASYPLSLNIDELSFIDDTSLSYLTQSDVRARLDSSTLTGEERTTLWRDNVHGLTFTYSNGQHYLSTKPTGATNGFVYALVNGRLEKVMSGERGLSFLPKDTGEFLYSVARPREATLFYRNEAENIDHELPAQTLADKCIWSPTEENVVYCAVPRSFPQALYPDAWYQGKVSFNDVLVKINVDTLKRTVLLDPSHFSRPEVDMTDIAMSENGAYLSFVNKKDYSLWAVKLPEALSEE